MVQPSINDIQPTVEAATILASLRLRHSAEIPLPIWQMMANAEARLNLEIEAYFRAPNSLGRNSDTPDAYRHPY